MRVFVKSVLVAVVALVMLLGLNGVSWAQGAQTVTPQTTGIYIVHDHPSTGYDTVASDPESGGSWTNMVLGQSIYFYMVVEWKCTYYDSSGGTIKTQDWITCGDAPYNLLISTTAMENSEFFNTFSTNINYRPLINAYAPSGWSTCVYTYRQQMQMQASGVYYIGTYYAGASASSAWVTSSNQYTESP